MDQPGCTTLSARLQDVPDPRHKRGQSYEWLWLLNLIAAAITGGAKSMAAIADWIHPHAPDLLAALRNAIMAAIRYHSWTNVAAGLRHYDARPQQALQLIGAIAT